MPAWDRVYTTTAAAPITVVTTAETVALTFAGINTPSPSATLAIVAQLDFTTGTGVTGVVLRVRRTGLTGTLVGSLRQSVSGASVQGAFDIVVVDAPPDIASGPYVVTVVQTGATGNGQVNTGSAGVAFCFT